MTLEEKKNAQAHQLTSEQVEMLKWVNDTLKDELQQWRQNRDSIFTWVTTVFLAALAGIMALLRESPEWSDHVRVAQWGASVVVISVAGGSLIYFWVNRINYERCAHTISRISHALGLFEPGRYMEGTVFPERWATWGEGWWRRKGAIIRTVLIIVLAAALVGGIWLIE